MSKAQPPSNPRTHACLVVMAPFKKSWFLTQIWLGETRAECGTERRHTQPAAGDGDGGGASGRKNTTVTVDIQHKFSPQVTLFFRFQAADSFLLLFLSLLNSCPVICVDTGNPLLDTLTKMAFLTLWWRTALETTKRGSVRSCPCFSFFLR